MDLVIQIINSLYGKGYSFNKEFTIPWINRKVNATINITAKSPTKFSFTPNSDGGTLLLDPGVQVNLVQLGIKTTLTRIDITKDVVTIHSTGCPAFHYSLN